MKSLKVYWIIAGVLILLYIIAEANRPKEINWTESLSSKEKTPFGTYILKSRLGDIFPKSFVTSFRKPVYNVIAEDTVKNATYLIIAPGIELSKQDYGELIKYIKKGNDVFIASEYFGSLLEKDFKISTKESVKLNGKATQLGFVSKMMDTAKYYSLPRGIGDVYFDSFDTLKAIVIGHTKKHKANFLKIPIDKGNLYFMCNPEFFTNYSLLRPNGKSYAATMLAYLKKTPEILFDEYYTQGDGGAETPMRVFLNTPALAWAYYITLFSLLLFVVYDIKRRQRVIPVIEPLNNATLDFVTVVGQLYYEKGNNADIAKKKITYLLNWLRDKYQLKTQQPDDDFSATLVQKLGLKPGFSAELTGYINYINNCDMVTDKELIRLNNLTDQFYNQAQ